MKVLLLVDLQNDFCPGGALAVPGGDEVIAVANQLMQAGRHDIIIASQDCHPVDHVSFVTNHPGKELFQQIDVAYAAGDVTQQTLWPIHCVEGSRGAEFHPDLQRDLIHYTVKKGRNPAIDSYSAFFDNERRQETGLRQILEDQAMQRGETLRDIKLAVCGLALDFCVAATARDARFLNIETHVVLDACRAVNIQAGDDIRTLRDLAEIGVIIEESRSLLEQERAHERSSGKPHELHP